MRPERVGVETSARSNLGILDDGGGVQLAEQKTRVGVAGGREERAGRIEPGGLHVTEAEGCKAAVRALALVGVHALRLRTERGRMFAMSPVQIVLDRIVVQIFREGSRVGAAPLRRRVGAGKRNLRKRRIGLARRQPAQTGLDRILAVDRRVENRH